MYLLLHLNPILHLNLLFSSRIDGQEEAEEIIDQLTNSLRFPDDVFSDVK